MSTRGSRRWKSPPGPPWTRTSEAPSPSRSVQNVAPPNSTYCSMNRILADVGGENGVGHGQGRALDPAAPSACSDRGIHVLGGENGLVLDPISLPQAPPGLRGRRVVLREGKPSDIDDRLAFPIAPEDEDMFGGSWRREWRGELRHTRENLEALAAAPGPPGHVDWAVEHA